MWSPSDEGAGRKSKKEGRKKKEEKKGTRQKETNSCCLCIHAVRDTARVWRERRSACASLALTLCILLCIRLNGAHQRSFNVSVVTDIHRQSGRYLHTTSAHARTCTHTGAGLPGVFPRDAGKSALHGQQCSLLSALLRLGCLPAAFPPPALVPFYTCQLQGGGRG